jgi:hypothetical protein
MKQPVTFSSRGLFRDSTIFHRKSDTGAGARRIRLDPDRRQRQQDVRVTRDDGEQLRHALPTVGGVGSNFVRAQWIVFDPKSTPPRRRS